MGRQKDKVASRPANLCRRVKILAGRFMTRKIGLILLGAMLLAGAPSQMLANRRSAAKVTSSKNKKKTAKASSRSKKKKKSRTAKGQKAPTAERVMEIQSALQREGALDGQPTGKWDSSTVEGMKKYQSSHGLNPTGKIDAATLQKLGLGSDTAGKGAPIPSASSDVTPANSSP